MSDPDPGAAEDRAPDDRETPPDDAATSGDSGGSSDEATDDRVGEAVSDALPEDDESDEETARREARTVSAAEGNGDGGTTLGEDAAAPDVDESRVFDTLQDEYDPTDFEDIEPEVERQFPGEVDFDHLVAGDIEFAEGDDDPWLGGEETAGSEPRGTPEAGGEVPEVSGDNAVVDLVTDIRSGAVNDEELDALRQALGLQTPRHMDVRLRHVQSRIDDLAAYIETLETFIDEEGTPIQILDRTRERLETLEGQIDVVKRGLVSARTERQSIADRVAAVEGSVDEAPGEHFEAEMTQLRARVDDLAEAVDGDGAAAEEVTELQADLADALEERRDLRESVEAVREEQRRIRDVFEGIAGEFAER